MAGALNYPFDTKTKTGILQSKVHILTVFQTNHETSKKFHILTPSLGQQGTGLFIYFALFVQKWLGSHTGRRNKIMHMAEDGDEGSV